MDDLSVVWPVQFYETSTAKGSTNRSDQDSTMYGDLSREKSVFSLGFQ
jgi:hypothetical protein